MGSRRDHLGGKPGSRAEFGLLFNSPASWPGFIREIVFPRKIYLSINPGGIEWLSY